MNKNDRITIFVRNTLKISKIVYKVITEFAQSQICINCIIYLFW